jgi:hypothetical protein
MYMVVAKKYSFKQLSIATKYVVMLYTFLAAALYKQNGTNVK